jgi:hypothetical protein
MNSSSRRSPGDRRSVAAAAAPATAAATAAATAGPAAAAAGPTTAAAGAATAAAAAAAGAAVGSRSGSPDAVGPVVPPRSLPAYRKNDEPHQAGAAQRNQQREAAVHAQRLREDRAGNPRQFSAPSTVKPCGAGGAIVTVGHASR